LHLIACQGSRAATGHAVEFAGPAIEGMSVEGRATLCNMAVEMGAFTGVVAPDATTLRYVREREYAPTGLVDDFDDNDGCPEPMAWTPGTLGDVRVDWRSTEDPEGLREALRKFLTYGFVIVHDSPVRDLAVIEVAERFGKVRDTNFGRHFEVYARPNPEDANDLAYTALRLDPHTDNPYRDPVPGIQLLHCLVNESSGGLSTLADSIAVTDELSRAHPEGFRLLCEVPIRYRFWDRDAELVKRHPMISVSAHGKVTGTHDSPKRDFLPLLPHDQGLAYHEARQLLSKLLVDDRFEYRFTLQSGEAMMFDNNRVDDSNIRFVYGQLARLACQVVVLPGNHDVHDASSVWNRFDFDVAGDHVHGLLSTTGDSVDLDAIGVRVWGRAMTEHAPENYPLDGAPVRRDGHWNIGMAHGQVCDRRIGQGSSPITCDEIRASGFDYLALGHIHVWAEHSEGATKAFYCGSPVAHYAGSGGGKVAVVTLCRRTGVSVASRQVSTVEFSKDASRGFGNGFPW